MLIHHTHVQIHVSVVISGQISTARARLLHDSRATRPSTMQRGHLRRPSCPREGAPTGPYNGRGPCRRWSFRSSHRLLLLLGFARAPFHGKPPSQKRRSVPVNRSSYRHFCRCLKHYVATRTYAHRSPAHLVRRTTMAAGGGESAPVRSAAALWSRR
jgi:hypothetical protein